MKVIKTIAEMKTWSDETHTNNKSISFVPTMGNLHNGHLSLVDAAKKVADKVVVSIYVNPTQFAANEDLDKYPRSEQKDLQLLEEKKVDVVFMPSSTEMYPNIENIDYIDVPELASELEGKSRPDHFRGVATIVKKLFDCVEPDHAIFGEKDFQQLLIVKNMVIELNLNVTIHGEAIIRDDDGLAKSSRNQYLTGEQRQKAPILHQALLAVREEVLNGNQNYNVIELQSIDFINKNGFDVDYFVIRDADTLGNPTGHNQVILVAAALGNTRLLDNLRVGDSK